METFELMKYREQNLKYVNEKRLDQMAYLQKLLKELSNKLVNENVIPEQWTEINLLPIPKSDDLSQTGN